jgi:CSLREA domain-containing protein
VKRDRVGSGGITVMAKEAMNVDSDRRQGARCPSNSDARANRYANRVVQRALIACLLSTSGACAWAALTLTINSTVDAVDASSGNRVCSTAAGKCTLRAAIQESNA